MLSSLLRPKKRSTKRQREQREQRSIYSSPYLSRTRRSRASRSAYEDSRLLTTDYGESDDESDVHGEDDEDEDEDEGEDEDEEIDGDEDELEDVDGVEHEETTPLLPIFEASHLDSLPVYNLTHSLRFLIVPRCETTLTWDQLRSPQVSQFMVKPIQRDILTSHFSRATLYALMSNCLQFLKEADENPGNSGTSRTRAMVCELLAIKLLREYSIRELIDALSYDFYPLQGLSKEPLGFVAPAQWSNGSQVRLQTRAARISTLEVAIRAQAKRLLAHPLVVQQLAAIWAGNIVFHSAADSMHRLPNKLPVSRPQEGYGAIESNGNNTNGAAPEASEEQPAASTKPEDRAEPLSFVVRRTVTLYNPREASLFKLSRLRVPRYRQFLSTCSLAVLLALFTAVLYERSQSITTLEIIFWFWSAGFMLDEVVGFTEQGFSLYLMSFWNSFDVGILILLAFYYCLRLYGLLISDNDKRQVANLAYDVLAVNAVLLFPRLFSVLDHYRYFSQLLIAFRMMARDLVAILILIVIACSGFFVAFSFAFGNDSFGASNVAYALFQILMGFTPAAWEQWSNYNVLGRATLVFFLFITHFLVVTILITVLTNSFMAIVANANDEHQFVFAVNTISMVKSDALFSYIAPTNIIAWLLTPLRNFVSFPDFVYINRVVVKITHAPVLWAIFAYERLILRSSVYEPTDLVEQRGRARGPQLLKPQGVISPGQARLRRERSVATFVKDRALEEVFRRPYRNDPLRQAQSQERRQTSHVVNNWMQTMGPEGRASPPLQQDDQVLASLERPRQRIGRSSSRQQERRDITSMTRSVASDPAEFQHTRLGEEGSPHRNAISFDSIDRTSPYTRDLVSPLQRQSARREKEKATDYFQARPPVDQPLRQPTASHTSQSLDASPGERHGSISFDASSYRHPSQESVPQQDSIPISPPPRNSPPRKPHHYRNFSTNTIVYNPVPPSPPPKDENDNDNEGDEDNAGAAQPAPLLRSVQRKFSGSTNPSSSTSRNETLLVPSPKKASAAGRRTPKRQNTGVGRSRPLTAIGPTAPPRQSGLQHQILRQSSPNRRGGAVPIPKSRSALALDLASDLGDNKAAGGGFVGAVPASFSTQMAWMQQNPNSTAAATAAAAAARIARREQLAERSDEQSRMSKLMLVRMNTLEEGFKEVLREVKEWRRGAGDVALPLGSGGTSLAGGSQRAAGGGAGGSGNVSASGSGGIGVGLRRSGLRGGRGGQEEERERERERERGRALGGGGSGKQQEQQQQRRERERQREREREERVEEWVDGRDGERSVAEQQQQQQPQQESEIHRSGSPSPSRLQLDELPSGAEGGDEDGAEVPTTLTEDKLDSS